VSDENCNKNTLWSKTENGAIECNKHKDNLYIEIGIWRENQCAYNEYVILNKSVAIQLRDFLNQFIEEQNENEK